MNRVRPWMLLVPLSAGLSVGMHVAGLPAAFLLGSMIAGMIVAARGHRLRVAGPHAAMAQAMIGCMVSTWVTAAILANFLDHWPLFAFVTCSTLGGSSLLGYVMTRRRFLPGTTAIWGTSPGASTATALMAEAYGADIRIVAFMQYLRVVCVALGAALLSALLARGAGDAAPAVDLLATVPARSMAVLSGVAGAGMLLGWLLRLPTGFLVGPLLLGSILNILGLVDLAVPQWLMLISYVLIGWKIGLTFNREAIAGIAVLFPRMLLSVLLLMAFCGVLAALLVVFAGVSPATAYLATSPGGMDAIAVIAATSPVDVPFVMSLQVVRFLAVLLVGPMLANWVARRHGEIEAGP